MGELAGGGGWWELVPGAVAVVLRLVAGVRRAVRAAVQGVLGLVQGWLAGEGLAGSVLVVVTRGAVAVLGMGGGAGSGGGGGVGAGAVGAVGESGADRAG